MYMHTQPRIYYYMEKWEWIDEDATGCIVSVSKEKESGEHEKSVHSSIV